MWKDMWKGFLLLIGLPILIVFLGGYCESKKDPYEEGGHWDYSIECENGFVYKSLDHRRGTIQVLNSDGTPLKCGEKIH
jgi:hypothetical protein